MARQKVLVAGGTGHFGRLLLDDLLRFADCDLVVGSRRSIQSNRFETRIVDLRCRASVEVALTAIAVVICAAGPFQGFPLTLVELCMEHGIHYIDLADDRNFVRRVHSLVSGNTGNLPAICSGWSTICALSGALAQIGAAGLNKIQSIHIHMAPGNRGARHHATIASLMHSVGQPFLVFRQGVWHRVIGWSEPRDFVFASPIGRRCGYLVDVPDHEFFPDLFRARTVEFRTGSEFRPLNTFVSMLRWLAENRVVHSWVGWSGILQRSAGLLSWMGHDWGALGVEVSGARNRRVSILAESAGERIAVMPASIMATSLLSGRQHRGLVSPADWIEREQLRIECEKRGFRFLVEDL